MKKAVLLIIYGLLMVLTVCAQSGTSKSPSCGCYTQRRNPPFNRKQLLFRENSAGSAGHTYFYDSEYGQRTTDAGKCAGILWLHNTGMES